MRWPFTKVYVTQKWGVNPNVYSRFGYKGHNGVDFRLFDEAGNRASTSLIFAPHDGVVKERRNDPNGYGNYLKIESDVEGSILAHLKEFKVNINKRVKEGELVGIADNTGWSTGAHLHWGYYRHPRNRQNGYGGTIDPTPYIKPKEESMPDNGCKDLLKKYGTKTTQELDDKIHEHVGTTWGGEDNGGHLGGERKKNKEFKMAILNLEGENAEYKSKLEEFYKIGYRSAAQVKADLESYTQEIGNLKEQIKIEKDRADAARAELNKLLSATAKALNTVQEPSQVYAALSKLGAELDRLDDLERQYADLQVSSGKEQEELRAEIERLKAIVKTGDLQEYKLEELLSEIIRRLTSIVRK